VRDVRFAISPRLAAGLRSAAADGRPPYELALADGPLVEDVSDVPPDAEYVATRGTAANVPRVGHLEQLTALWADPATPALFSACATAPRLRALYVSELKQLADVPLAGAPALEHLMLAWALRLADISFLGALPALRTVYLDDMRRIDLSTLPELPEVTGFHLGGGVWNTLKVDTLSSLVRLPGLRFLRLSNVRPADGSLRPLASLTRLRAIDLPNFFALEEYARLSVALPQAKGNALTPYFAAFDGTPLNSPPFVCPRCNGARRMMTGRPALLLCPSCDVTKVQRRLARWEAARTSPWPLET